VPPIVRIDGFTALAARRSRVEIYHDSSLLTGSLAEKAVKSA
jgi:hypothetical protein